MKEFEVNIATYLSFARGNDGWLTMHNENTLNIWTANMSVSLSCQARGYIPNWNVRIAVNLQASFC